MPAAMNPTLAPDLLNDLQDPTGKPLSIGSRVRSFDFTFGYSGERAVLGTDLEGQLANFIEGTITGIGEVIEGCERYRIEADKIVRAGEVQNLDFEDTPVLFNPPTNGTPTTTGGVMACVYLIEDT